MAAIVINWNLNQTLIRARRLAPCFVAAKKTTVLNLTFGPLLEPFTHGRSHLSVGHPFDHPIFKKARRLKVRRSPRLSSGIVLSHGAAISTIQFACEEHLQQLYEIRRNSPTSG